MVGELQDELLPHHARGAEHAHVDPAFHASVSRARPQKKTRRAAVPSAGCARWIRARQMSQRADATAAATMLSHGRGRGRAPVIVRPSMSGSIGCAAARVKRHQAFLCFRNVHKFDAASARADTMDGSRHGHAASRPRRTGAQHALPRRAPWLRHGRRGGGPHPVRAAARRRRADAHLQPRVARKRVDWVPASVRWTEDIARRARRHRPTSSSS